MMCCCKAFHAGMYCAECMQLCYLLCKQVKSGRSLPVEALSALLTSPNQPQTL